MRSENFRACWLAAILLGAMPAMAADKTTFSLRTYIEHDDNVSLVSDDEFAADPIEGTGAGVMLTAGRTLHRTATTELRGSIVGFHTAQLSSDAEDLDVTGVVPRLTLSGRARIGSRGGNWNTSLSLRRDWLGGEGFSRLIDLTAGMQLNLARTWSIGPSYTISSRDYDDEGFDPEVTSRNALRHTLGLSSQWTFKSPAGARAPARFSLSAGSQRNAADGSDFEFHGAVFGANLDLPLTPASARTLSDFSLQAALSVADVDYDDFGLEPKRSDRRLAASLTLSARLRPLGRVDLSWSRLDLDSNRPEYQAQRNVLRLGVTHSFR